MDYKNMTTDKIKHSAELDRIYGESTENIVYARKSMHTIIKSWPPESIAFLKELIQESTGLEVDGIEGIVSYVEKVFGDKFQNTVAALGILGIVSSASNGSKKAKEAIGNLKEKNPGLSKIINNAEEIFKGEE